LAGGALNVFYRDIRFAVPLIIQVWMYATPIVYPASLVPDRFRQIYALNPMVGIVESYRNIFVRGAGPDWSALAIGCLPTLFLLVVGYTFFKRVEPQFADII
jgi:lipopolysaccharide transport system permease protein